MNSIPVPSDLHAAQSERAKRVLIVSTGSRFSSFPIAEQAIVDRLREVHPAELEFYSEYLDIVRFSSERYQRLFRDYLRDKYAQDLPDLIFLIFVGNLGTAGELLGELFPRAPVVVVGLTEEDLPVGSLPGRVTGLAQRSDPAGTLELMLRLQPEVRRIVLVGGTAEVDRHVMSRAQAAVRGHARRVEFEVWDKRSMPEILTAASSLPPQSAILFTRMFRDGAGGAVNSSQAARAIAKVSNVPVYVMTDTMLGTGALGGSTVDLVALGGRAGEIADRILNGTEPESLPLEIITRGVPIFDWQALMRWRIDESRLPQNSIVRFRPPSMWEQYRWHVMAAVAIFSLQGALIAGLIVSRVRRRRTENQLQENQEMMEMAANAGGLGLWVRDLKSDQMWANSVLRSLFGLGPNDALRTNDILARIHPDDNARVVAEVERARDRNSLFEGEFRTLLPDGGERWVLAKGAPVNIANGGDARRMGVLLDITASKASEAELQRNRDELAHMTRVATLGELAASLAHELNQPLGAILSNADAAEMLLSTEPSAIEEVREILVDIRNDDRRASDVIRGLRGLLRKHEIERQPMQINDAVGEVLRLLGIDAAQRKVALTFEPAENLPLVEGDRVKLQQVVMNLVLNAMDATAELADGQCRVVVGSGAGDDGTIMVSVSDSGPGITADRLPKLFEPFFTTKKDGMGMGLSIARTIVEAHHGRIWAENNPEGGAIFCFTLAPIKDT